jgi:hypothetical protein
MCRLPTLAVSPSPSLPLPALLPPASMYHCPVAQPISRTPPSKTSPRRPSGRVAPLHMCPRSSSSFRRRSVWLEPRLRGAIGGFRKKAAARAGPLAAPSCALDAAAAAAAASRSSTTSTRTCHFPLLSSPARQPVTRPPSPAPRAPTTLPAASSLWPDLLRPPTQPPAMPSVAERSNATLYPSSTADWVQPESRPAEIDGLIAGVGRSFTLQRLS